MRPMPDLTRERPGDRGSVLLDTEMSPVRAFLRALGDPDPAALARWVARRDLPPDWADWIVAQSLGPYLLRRLQASGAHQALPPGALATLRADYYQAVAANAIQRRELADILEVLGTAGIKGVLLKGTALAYTVYDEPACRLKGDIDIWVQFEELDPAISALRGLGYQPADKADRPRALMQLVGGEQQMVSPIPGTGLVELQWPAFRGEWIRHTAQVDHQGIHRRCLPLQVEGRDALVMAPEDVLIHLCHHLAISHQFGHPWVRGLLDIHLVVQRFNPDWSEVVTHASEWRLATVAWTVLGLAQSLLDTPIPVGALQALAPAPWRRRTIEWLCLEQRLLEMSAGGYSRQRFWIQLLLTDRARDARRLVARGLCPESAWLRARYGVRSPAELWRERLLHPWRLLTSARA